MVKKAKHTPGRWHQFEAVDNGACHSIGAWLPDGKTRYLIAETYSIFESGAGKIGECETEQANARLIVAAPELLEAAERMVRDQERPVFSMDFRGAIDALRAAIAKATGD